MNGEKINNEVHSTATTPGRHTTFNPGLEMSLLIQFLYLKATYEVTCVTKLMSVGNNVASKHTSIETDLPCPNWRL